MAPDRREAVLRRCFDSEEFSRRRRKIRWICFLSTVIPAIAIIEVLPWTGIAARHVALAPVVGLSIIVFFVALMVIARIWLELRLLRKLVRRELQKSAGA